MLTKILTTVPLRQWWYLWSMYQSFNYFFMFKIFIIINFGEKSYKASVSVQLHVVCGLGVLCNGYTWPDWCGMLISMSSQSFQLILHSQEWGGKAQASCCLARPLMLPDVRRPFPVSYSATSLFSCPSLLGHFLPSLNPCSWHHTVQLHCFGTRKREKRK